VTVLSRYFQTLILSVCCVFASAVCFAETPLEAAQRLPIIEDADASNTQGVFFGLFRASLLTDVPEESAADLRRKPASLMWFSRFGGDFPESAVLFLHQQGMLAHIAWEPWNAYGQGIPLADIVAGKWDDYLDTYAKDAARVDLPVLLRLGHEMNGDWYPWSLDKNGRNAELYVQAFRHIVERFRKLGANKVQFVWCINNVSVPEAGWNALAASYPGDDYVNWVGIDGYNFGTSQNGSAWRSFEQTFRPAYEAVVKRAPGKPILIGEMASSETGGNKAQWIKEMFRVLPTMPNIRAITWFDILKETSWNVDSSDAAWQAMIEGLRLPWVRGNGEAMAHVGAKP
jgi:hypothetical protein